MYVNRSHVAEFINTEIILRLRTPLPPSILRPRLVNKGEHNLLKIIALLIYIIKF
jgi:hypothetical protein